MKSVDNDCDEKDKKKTRISSIHVSGVELFGQCRDKTSQDKTQKTTNDLLLRLEYICIKGLWHRYVALVLRAQVLYPPINRSITAVTDKAIIGHRWPTSIVQLDKLTAE